MECLFFYDTNPNCPENEKYKAIGRLFRDNDKNHFSLWCFTSPDGYTFKKTYHMTDEGWFDSINTVIWRNGRYSCYLRDFHEGIRDIRVMYSEDFKTWTTSKPISFDDGKDYPLYTNNVVAYERAPHILVGFPVRYCEKEEWTANAEQLVSSAVKKNAMEKVEKRAGLAVTDCIFMCSRDGEMWHRYNEAFGRR